MMHCLTSNLSTSECEPSEMWRYVHCGPKTVTLFHFTIFLQMLINFYNIWHTLY